MAQAKKTVSKKDTQQVLAIPATLPWHDQEEENARSAEDAKKADENKNYDELRSQIAALTSGLEEARRTNMALMSQTPKYTPPAPKGVDTANLPDPTVDPQGYTKELNRRITAAQQEQQRYTQYQQEQVGQQQSKLNALWEDFTDRYGDYATDQRKVRYAAEAAVQRAQARGIDVDKYMYANSDQFMRDVVAQYDKDFGKPGGAAAEQTHEEEDGEAASVFGGAQSGGRPSGREEPENDDMFSDLKQFQMERGWHR